MSAWWEHVLWLSAFLWCPERVLGFFILGFYLFVWLPWGLFQMIPHGWVLHMTLLVVYMVVPPMEHMAFRRWRFFKMYRALFYPSTAIYSEHNAHRPDPAHPTLYAISPHGCYFEAGCTAFVMTSAFKHVRSLGSSVLWKVPILKELVTLVGAKPISAKEIQKQLYKDKGSISIVPEGMRGAVARTDPHTIPIRKGFIRCAAFELSVQPSVDDKTTLSWSDVRIVPVYIQGSWTLFHTWPGAEATKANSAIRRFQHWLLSTPLIACPLIWFGRWGTLLPLPEDPHNPIVLKFGAPIYCRGKTVDAIYHEYMTARMRLEELVPHTLTLLSTIEKETA